MAKDGEETPFPSDPILADLVKIMGYGPYHDSNVLSGVRYLVGKQISIPEIFHYMEFVHHFARLSIDGNPDTYEPDLKGFRWENGKMVPNLYRPEPKDYVPDIKEWIDNAKGDFVWIARSTLRAQAEEAFEDLKPVEKGIQQVTQIAYQVERALRALERKGEITIQGEIVIWKRSPFYFCRALGASIQI